MTDQQQQDLDTYNIRMTAAMCETEECCSNYGCDCFECPDCKGSGYVNPLTAPKDFFCAGTTDCPSCDGTGEI